MGAIRGTASTLREAQACVAVGDDFLARAAALALTVPSVVVPQERNALINPLHPAAADLRIVSDEPFRFDPRLVGDGA